MLGESGRGTHIHSTLPDGAISALVSQSERNPYSPMCGNLLRPSHACGAASSLDVCPFTGP